MHAITRKRARNEAEYLKRPKIKQEAGVVSAKSLLSADLK